MKNKILLHDVADIIMGQSPPGSSYNEEKKGLKFFQGVKDFGLRYPKDRVYCSEPKKIAKKGDIILTVRAPIGRVNLVNDDFAIGRGLCIVRPKEKTDAHFLEFSLMRLESFWNSMEGGGTIFGNLTRDDLMEIEIFWPKESLRKTYGCILNDLSEKICNLAEQNSHMEELMIQIVAGLLNKKLNNTKLSQKDGWKIKPLEKLCDLITDGSHYSPKEISDNNKMIATVKNMTEYDIDVGNCKKISDDDYDKLVKSNCKPKKFDVLFSKDGTMGKCILFNGYENLVLLSSIAILRTNEEISNTYLKLYLSQNNIQEILKKGHSTGTAINRIVLDDMKILNVTYPPKEIITKLDDAFIRFYELIFKNFELQRNLIVLRDCLIKKLIKLIEH